MTFTTNYQIRQFIRNDIRYLRKNLTKQEQDHASQKITDYIINEHRIQQAKHIGLFINFDGEIQTYPLIRKLLNIGKKIYLPILYSSHHKISKKLLFSKYTLSTNLIRNNFKIHEPKLNIRNLISIQELDIVFIPLVAFDQYGHRLGMGGGFYDYTFNPLNNNKQHIQKTLIGLAHDCQKINNIIPTEIWDVNLPEIITPTYHWKWI